MFQTDDQVNLDDWIPVKESKELPIPLLHPASDWSPRSFALFHQPKSRSESEAEWSDDSLERLHLDSGNAAKADHLHVDKQTSSADSDMLNIRSRQSPPNLKCYSERERSPTPPRNHKRIHARKPAQPKPHVRTIFPAGHHVHEEDGFDNDRHSPAVVIDSPPLPAKEMLESRHHTQSLLTRLDTLIDKLSIGEIQHPTADRVNTKTGRRTSAAGSHGSHRSYGAHHPCCNPPPCCDSHHKHLYFQPCHCCCLTFEVGIY